MSAPADALRERVQAMRGERVDLTTIDTSTPRPWTRGAHRILRPRLKVLWFAARESLKSMGALLLSVQIIEDGGTVAFLDFENGARRMADRLASILADRDPEVRAAVAQRLDYTPTPRLAPLGNPGLRQAWAESFAGADLVIIDSAARALAQLGLDESSNADFSRFVVDHIDSITERGPAVLVLDNTGWSEQERSRGASNKWDLCELVYKVSADPIAPDRHGTIRLQRVRSRDGDEAPMLEVGAGDGSYGRVQPTLPGEDDRQLERALIEHVEAHPGEATADVAKAIGKRKDRARSRLEILEAAGTVHRAPSQRRDRRGRTITRTGWYPGPPQQLCAVPDPGTHQDPPAPRPVVGPGSAPFKAGPGPGTTPDSPNGRVSDADLDHAEALIAEHEAEVG